MGRPGEQQPYDFASNGMGVTNGLNGLGGMNAGPGFGQDNVLSVPQQQMQYQAYLQSRGMPQTGMYPGNIGGNVYQGYAGAMDNMRGLQGAGAMPGPSQVNSNAILGQPAFAPPQFSPVLNPAQMYQYSPQYYPQAQAIPNQAGAGRRGRVSLDPR